MEQHFSNYRSNCPEVIYEKGVVRSFAKFTGKYLYLSLFFDKVAAATLSKQRLRYRCFPVNFVKFLRTLFYTEHVQWLFLELTKKSPI